MALRAQWSPSQPLDSAIAVSHRQSTNERGRVPIKLYLQILVEGQIYPTGHGWLAPTLQWGQKDLSKRQIGSYLLSCLKAFSVSPSFPPSSQSSVDLAPGYLSHWRLRCAICIVCTCVLFAVPRTRNSICQCHTFAHLSPYPTMLFIFLLPASGNAACLCRFNPYTHFS